MNFEKFIKEIPEETKILILNAIDIYKEIESKNLKYKTYDDEGNENFKYLSKLDKVCTALFLSGLITECTAKKVLEDHGITFQRVLKYFGLSNIKMRDSSLEEYRQCYQKDFKPLMDELEYSDFYSHNSSFYPEALICILAYGSVCDSEIVDLILESFKNSTSILEALECIVDMQINDNPELDFDKEDEEKKKEDIKMNFKPKPQISPIPPIRQVNNEKIVYLENYGEYLTNKTFLVNPAIGREKEIKSLMLSLATSDKSAILTGESGVGKTAIVEGLAYLIKTKNVPKFFNNYKIFKINTSSLVRGCSLVGMFEERVESIINELMEKKKTILFIDELHTAIGAGAGSKANLDLANILKPYLDRGQLKMIGATTNEEYEYYIEKDKAFKRRFERIKVLEPNPEVIYQILDNSIPMLEKLTSVKCDLDENNKEQIFRYIIEATKKNYRVQNDMAYNPDLSLSILKKAFAIAVIEENDTIKRENIAQALMSCDRLYEESRKRYANLLLNSIETKKANFGRVLNFPIK